MFRSDKFLDGIRNQVRKKEDANKKKRMYPVKFTEKMYLEAKLRAVELDLSMNKYIQRCVEMDIKTKALKKY